MILIKQHYCTKTFGSTRCPLFLSHFFTGSITTCSDNLQYWPCWCCCLYLSWFSSLDKMFFRATLHKPHHVFLMSSGTSCLLQIHGETFNFASIGWAHKSLGHTYQRDAWGFIPTHYEIIIYHVHHGLKFNYHIMIVWNLFHQEAITEYQGTVITVSHDRYFIKQIVNRVIEIKDGNLQDYAGDYNVSVTSLLL